ncbi:hypothetical protein SESBI_43847 [Sesbania bispinosa]|nr:hypothetical protein SESBI_43847 [Sesbania bispinosa]
MKKSNGISLYRYDNQRRDEFKDNDQKKKKAMVDNHLIGLHVIIEKAIGIDNPNRYPFVVNRYYNVVYWVEPGQELRTRVTEGMIPFWNQKGTIIMESLEGHSFLNVEVQRFNSTNFDPGTSNGMSVVGRARIPFPKEFNCTRMGPFPLVRTEGGSHRAEGHIVVAMKLEKVRIVDSLF